MENMECRMTLFLELADDISFRCFWDRTAVHVNGQEVGPNYFGISEQDFREYAKFTGLPRCAGFNKKGQPCGNAPHGFQCSPVDFAKRHRADLCYLHRPRVSRETIEGGCVLLRPTKFRGGKPKGQAQVNALRESRTRASPEPAHTDNSNGDLTGDYQMRPGRGLSGDMANTTDSPLEI